METKKPFVCKVEGCTMSFTNEDHLTVHTKKHAMVLHLSVNQKTPNFVGKVCLTRFAMQDFVNILFLDQTPTPTRLIKNCDEVGLFEDLQHVNPFDETFRRAVESKSNDTTPTQLLPSDPITVEEETLHTPHVLPFYVCGDGTTKSCRKKLRIYTKSKLDNSSAVSENSTTIEPADHNQNGTSIIITNLPSQITSPATSTIHLSSTAQTIPILNQIQLERIHHQLSGGVQIRSNDCPSKASEVREQTNSSKKQLPILPKPSTTQTTSHENFNSIREKIKEVLKRKPKIEIVNDKGTYDGQKTVNLAKDPTHKNTSASVEKTAKVLHSERNREAAKRYR